MTRIIVRCCKALLIVGLAGYLLVAGYLYFFQRDLMYFPAPLAEPVDAQSLIFASDGLRLKAWVVNPGKPGALLYFGGNGERVEQRADFFRKWLPDTSVYLLAYRGYSGNPGVPGEKALFADALREFDAIRPRHQGMVVMGRSLGSGVATYLASQRPIDKLVLITPFDSIVNVAQGRYRMFPVSWLLNDRYESWKRAARIRARTLVLIAGRDEVVPRANTDFLVRHFLTAPMVVVFPQAGHNNIAEEPGYPGRLVGFLGAQKLDSNQGSPD